MTARLTDGQVILAVTCPHCGASKERRCHNGTGYAYTVPHAVRRRAAEAQAQEAGR